LELPTYTNIWRIEKRLYKLYDFRLPMPVPIGQIAVFAAIAVPYVVVLKVIGLPFSHTLLWLYILPPAALAWLITRPVLEGKRLPELVVSQLRYLSEPRTWCRMAPLAEKEEIAVIARVWRQVDAAAAVVPEVTAAVQEVASIETADVETAGIEVASVETADAETARAEAEAGARLYDVEIDDFDDVEIDDLEAADAETADAGALVTSQPDLAAAAETPPSPAEHQPKRSALTRHLPTGPVPAWPKAPAQIGRAPLPPAPAPAAREVPGQPAREMPAPPVREALGQPARAVPAPPPVRETPSRPAHVVSAPPPVREAPGQPARAVSSPPAPPVRDVPAPAARPVPPPSPPPPPRPRPMVTVTGNQPAEHTAWMVERALGKPAERRAGGWRDHVVFVPGGHRPGQPDPMQRDRARARLPVPGRHRIVVLGCTVGAGQTTTALLTGEVLASLRDDQVAALDLNPGPGSLAERAQAVPALAKSRPPAPSRLEVVTREAAAREVGVPGTQHPGEELQDVTKIFELLSARYPLTLADPAAAVVPRVLATASQLILVSPASQDAASALATTREWLEAHGHAGLAEGAIIVLNGVSRHTMPYVEQAEALARGRSRAIVRVPWDDHLKNQDPQRASAPAPGPHPSRAAGPLNLAALQAYTALAGVVVAALASAPGQLRARS